MFQSSIAIVLLLAVTCNDFTWGATTYSDGKVPNQPIDLDPVTFSKAINDPLNNFWFLKFYAPWCGHCKKMSPILESIAPDLEGKMAIGKIDCTKHKPLCNEHGVKGFPTLKYTIHGEFFDYTGGRDEKALIAFAKKMSAPPITIIKRLEEGTRFSQTKTEEGIAFLASDKSKESSKVYQIFEEVARRNQASGYFLWMTQSVNDEQDGKNSAYISRVEAGVVEPRYYDLDQTDALTVEVLEAWVKDQNVPTLITFGPNNFSRISKKKRPLVLGIVDMDNEELVKGIRAHIMDFILTTPQETVDKYYYGVFDGKRWKKFLEQFHVKEENNPQYLVLDMPKKLFWRNESYTKLRDFLKAISEGTIPAKKPDKSGFGDTPFAWIAGLFMDYFPYSLAPLVILMCLIVILVTPSKEAFPTPKFKPPADSTNTTTKDDAGDEPPEPESKKDQ